MDEYTKELRRIRITLIVIAIILVFFVSNREIVLEDNDDDSTAPSYFHNMVPLENGYFGILSNDASWDENGELNIYYYDSDKNELMLKKQVLIEELINKP